jgi:hypothetical protein
MSQDRDDVILSLRAQVEELKRGIDRGEEVVTLSAYEDALAKVEELTLELATERLTTETLHKTCDNLDHHRNVAVERAEQGEVRLKMTSTAREILAEHLATIAVFEKRRAEARLAAVGEALTRDPDNSWLRIRSALAAAREQPTQRCTRCGYSCSDPVCTKCGQPTQEPPPGNLWCNFHNKHREGPEAQCPDCAREQPTQEPQPPICTWCSTVSWPCPLHGRPPKSKRVKASR